MATPEQSKELRESRKLEAELRRKATRARHQRIRQETEATNDGRPSTATVPGKPSQLAFGEYDPLLEALIKEHPEKDPANVKTEEDDQAQ